jgi:hypothetical protein
VNDRADLQLAETWLVDRVINVLRRCTIRGVNIYDLLEHLHQLGHKVAVVGGSVRELLFGDEAKTSILQ